MTNQEKAWMLSGQRINAYKSYRDRHGWPRQDIHRAKELLMDQARAHTVTWAEDPEIKKLVQEQLDDALMIAEQQISVIVSSLKGLMASDRRWLTQVSEIMFMVTEALELMQEGRDE